MEKLNKTFKLNPLYEADGYKVGHPLMINQYATREYFTAIPRSLKYMGGFSKVASAGQQMVVRYIHSTFQENFFDQPIDVALKFSKDMSKYLGMDYSFDGFEKLHKLGYLPIKIKALPEGLFTKPNIPHLTGVTTGTEWAWLGLFLETLISKLMWQTSTAATIGNKFREVTHEWVMKTDKDNAWFIDYANHDFHSRGGNPFTSIAVGLGHAFSNKGSDTLNVIEAARYYYDVDDNDVVVNSVNASEHSVTTTGIFYYQRLLKQGKLNDVVEWYYSQPYPSEGSVDSPDYLAIAELLNLKDWLQKFPTGILSVVSDTFDLWKLITFILPRLKSEILAREGKLVIRPDSGDPVDIICGFERHKYEQKMDGHFYNGKKVEGNITAQSRGVIELLWDIFGGTINEQGYKVLDSHIGVIYGDSINLERQTSIYKRLERKGFAATNIVLGIGSYTYVFLTRDSAGWALKGAWFETLENGELVQYDIYKDPITDL
jgi:nicotinamide phosphoribosyltransferase